MRRTFEEGLSNLTVLDVSNSPKITGLEDISLG